MRRSLRRPLVIVMVSASLLGANRGYGQDSTATVPRLRVTPAWAIPVGAFGASLLLDGEVRSFVLDHRGRATDDAADIGNLFGDSRLVFPLLLGGYAIGKLANQDRFAAGVLRTGKAVALSSLSVMVLKISVGRGRPGPSEGDPDRFRPFGSTDGFRAFPSGHTAIAFAMATSIARDVRSPWARAALYGGATLTAFSRINDDRHWLSDVVAGATIGYVAGRLIGRSRVGLVAGPQGVGLNLDF